MISICIPVYNFDSTELVEQLSIQLKESSCGGELLLIDDASEDSFQEKNSKVKALCDRYIRLDKNIGRAQIRNLFLEYSTKEYLLFLDCDGTVESKNFLREYLDNINGEYPVIVGGRSYGIKPTNTKKWLAWEYGVKRESKIASVRSQNPNKSFMTNNFLIRKDILERIKFDESLSNYGHEDTLFGYELAKENIAILHIDNPVLNGDIEEVDRFLSKTSEGIKNLYLISSKLNHDKEFIKEIKLLKVWRTIRPISSLYTVFYRLFARKIDRNLKGKSPKMRALDHYKLREIIRVDRSLRL